MSRTAARPKARRAETAKTLKARRQHALRRLLSSGQVRTQAELVGMLAGEGIRTTQATVSRDLDEMGATRVRLDGGLSAYVIGPAPIRPVTSRDALRRIVEASVVSVVSSTDMVVVKTLPGHAQVVGSAIDTAGMADVVGTVGGDDTVLVIAAPRKGAGVRRELAVVAGEEGP